jgi:predicted extracellular nuclease
MNKTLLPILTAALLAGASQSQALILITEVNSNGAGGDFFEIYNTGSSSVDLTGWRWSDRDARSWSVASIFDSDTLNPGEVAVIGVGSNSASPTPLFGSATANSAFRSSWGLLSSVKMLTWTGTGAGLGSGDGVVLFNSTGNLAASLIYRVLPTAEFATQSDGSTVQLSTFIKATSPQPTASGHTSMMGGGIATDSLIWNYWGSTAENPTYFSSSTVGFGGAFANASSATTIGSPGVVPEPSSAALLGFGTLALFGLRRLNRKS